MWKKTFNSIGGNAVLARLGEAICDLRARPETKIGLTVFIVAMFFAVCTGHGWEDYWITFRASKNLATGNGLVFTPGERLHTFTSPLGVLLPAALVWLTGNHSDSLVFWLFRICSAGAFAAGVVLIYRMLKHLQIRPLACWFTLGVIALDAKLVDFTINGMETGLLVFFTALAVHGLLIAGPRQVLRAGAGWAGMMWSRPDSCIYIAVLGLGLWLFLCGKNQGQSHWAGLKKLLRFAAVCAVLYLPWFAWSWWYYGTPVPHTITAKGAVMPPMHAGDLAAALICFPGKLCAGYDVSLPFAFMPVYATIGGWSEGYVSWAQALGLSVAFLWLVPVIRPETRMFSLVFFAGNFYLSEVLKYFPPWYLPMVGLFGYLSLGLFVDQMLGLVARFPQLGWNRGWFAHLPFILRAGIVSLLAGQMFVLVGSARQLQVQQALIEDGMRVPVGRWLRAHAATPHDSVMLEPLGYIGYYSNLKMLDYPGLASKEVVEARKRLGAARQNQAYLELKPDWLVLRPNEVKNGTYVEVEGLAKYYELVQVFDASEKINAINWLPGRAYLQYDQTFLIYHRKAGADVNK